MSIGEHAHHPRPLFTHFSCTCGRELRVKRELEGTEVRCWDCRQMVRVPESRTLDPIFTSIAAGTAEFFDWRVLAVIGAVAMLATGLLFVRSAAPALEILVTIAVAAGYGLLVGGALLSESPESDEAESVTHARLAMEVIAALALGLALAMPWIPLLLHLPNFPMPIRIRRIDVLVFAVVSLVGPALMLLAFGRGVDGPLSPSQVLAIVRQRPFYVLLTLMLFPLGVILAEFAVFVASALLGWLPFLILEIYPDPDSIAESMGIHLPMIRNLGGLPHPVFVRMYGRRLAEGYALTGAVPMSLLRPANPIRFAWEILITPIPYLYHRLFCVALANFTVLLALGLQARWLAILTRSVSTRRPS